MKKQILFSLLFLGLCSIQLPAWAGDGATEESDGMGKSISDIKEDLDCDEETGMCSWSAAIEDPLKDRGTAVEYYRIDKGSLKTLKDAANAVGDTQYAKPSGLGKDKKVE